MIFMSISAKRRARHALVAVLCCALELLPCANYAAEPALPTLGDSTADDLSPIAERKLGLEIMREAHKEGDIFEDSPSTEYLNQFGAVLIEHAPPGTQPIEFFLVLDPQINAFALPGGFIAVNSGLIVAAQSESELAFVMSHEMGHVIQRHVARQIGHNKQTSLLALAGMILGAIAMAKSSQPDLGEATLMMSQNAALHSELAFSRDAEREADRVGFQIQQDSGFDISAIESFFKRVSAIESLYEGNNFPDWMHDHPLTSERIADINGRIRDQPIHQRVDSLDFNITRARLRVLQDTTHKGLIDTRAAMADQIHNGTYASEASIHYGLALAQMKLENFAAAQTELARVQALAPQPDFMIESLAIDLAVARHDNAAALRIAKSSLADFPQSRSIVYRYAETLQNSGHHDEAIAFLRDQLTQYKDEPALFELIAKSYEAQGKGMLEHQALAEEYYLNGGVNQAIQQLNLAKKSNDADFYAQSEIDARLRDLKSEWADLQKDQKTASRATGAAENGLRIQVSNPNGPPTMIQPGAAYNAPAAFQPSRLNQSGSGSSSGSGSDSNSN